MRVIELLGLIDDYAVYIRTANADFNCARRNGVSVNDVVGSGDILTVECLTKIMNGNTWAKPTDQVVLPGWLTQDGFSMLLSNVKTTIYS